MKNATSSEIYPNYSEDNDFKGKEYKKSKSDTKRKCD